MLVQSSTSAAPSLLRFVCDGSHEHLDINEVEWQAFLEDFQATLDKFEVPATEQAELFAIVESTKSDIVIA